MFEKQLHPNTRILMDAWRRMTASPDQLSIGPQASDYPGLVSRLFVIHRTGDGAWIFSVAGEAVSSLLGRELSDHDFLSLWSGHDRLIVSSMLEAIATESEPAVVRARGETLHGKRCNVEIPLAPLAGSAVRRSRILGLYQTLGGEPMLEGRHVWRHRLTDISMPDAKMSDAGLRLVASND